MSQCNDILNHMETQGSITALDALNLYGCFRLASRINDLRNRGHDICTNEITLDNGKTIASYTLIKEAQRELPL
jgi:hypothetical protein